MKTPQAQGLVPSLSVQAPMFCFNSFFGIYAETAQNKLDIYAGSRHFMWPIAHVRSHPFEYMRSHPVRPCPIYFSLCVDPSIYVVYAKSLGPKGI